VTVTKPTQTQYTFEETTTNFWGLIENTFERFAHKDFIVTTKGRISYNEADKYANALYAAFLKSIPQSNIGVGIFLKDSLKFPTAMLGALKAGHYFVPLDVSFPETTLKSIIETADIKILVTDDDNFSKASQLANAQQFIVNYDHLDLTTNQQITPYKFRLDDKVQIQFTSGSTGTPKGAIKNFRNLCYSLQTKLNNSLFKSGDRCLELSNFTFSALNSMALSTLFIGLTLYCSDPREDGLGNIAEWIKSENITQYHSTVTVFRTWAATLHPDEQFPTVISANAGAEKKTSHDLDLIKKIFPNVKHFKLGFASTEAGSVTSCTVPVDYEFNDAYIPCGWPNEDMEVMIWDADGNKLPQGQEGEIVVYSQYLARGYVNNLKLTQERFIPDPNNPVFQYYRTGDLGKIQEDGQLVHLGRVDNMVKIKGVRIELDNIEQKMLSYPGLLQATFNVFEDRKGNKKLAVYFLTEQDIQIPISDLRKFLADRLPTHQLPHYFIQLENFPLGRTGKLDKSQLPRPAMTRPPLSNPYVAPTNDIESTLVRIWEEEIGIEGIGVTDDFFDVGGDSLIGVVLFIHIERELGRNLPVSILLTASTIRSQATIISQTSTNHDFPPIITIRANGSNPPLFFIPGKGGFPTRIHHLAKLLNDNTPIYAMQDLLERGSSKLIPRIESTASFYTNEIRKIVPHGPYILVGESMGGLIAMEIAQQLTKLGDTVPWLAMLDTYYSGASETPRQKPSMFTRLVKKHFGLLATSDWDGRLDYLRFYRQNAAKRLSELSRRLKKEKAEARSNEYREMEERNLRAAQSYQARSYLGKVIQFKALRGHRKEDQANGWDKVQLGELVIHPLDCYHGSILFEPAVSELARVLNGYIANTEDNPTS